MHFLKGLSPRTVGIGAAVTGIYANKASDDLSGMSYVGTTPSPAIKSQRDKVKSRALTTDILAGAGIVTLATTLVWTFARPDPAPEVDQKPAARRPTMQPTVGLGSVGLQGEF